MNFGPAVPDAAWLEPPDLYLARGGDVEIDRPLFQGDVFADIPILQLPTTPPGSLDGSIELAYNPQLAMLVPHPCQCYNGDNVRPYLTVAPVSLVEDYTTFGEDRKGAKDKFALPDLLVPNPSSGTPEALSYVANLGRLTSVPKKYFKESKRISCLSHQGLGLLAKRLTMFQLRHEVELANAMAYTMEEWHEAKLMQAWVRKHGKLKGFSTFLRTPVNVPGVGDGLTAPYEVRAGAIDALLELITGDPVLEPES